MSPEVSTPTPAATGDAATLLVPVAGVPRLAQDAFLARVRAAVAGGQRPVALWGRPGDDPDEVVLTAVLATCAPAPAGPAAAAPASPAAGLAAVRTTVSRARGYPALSADLHRFHAWEREVWEQHGVTPHGHPWLKPIRFPGGGAGMDAYPFFTLHGKEVHEVAVGPIHAGVIEPGAFRFMCHGERVHHLEIHLGYQHRGAERLLLQRPPRTLAGLVESLAGDTSVAYALGHARALEALAGHRLDPAGEPIRGVALELERIAMHLVGLGGLATDVAFLPGAATYGRLRTGVINLTQAISGNRFGRGWLRPGGSRAAMDAALVDTARRVLADLARDLETMNALMFSAATVRHRLAGTGVVTRAVAEEIGLVGLAARACGVPVDQRVQLPCGVFSRFPVPLTTEPDGDCWARCRLRAREVEASLAWLRTTFDALGGRVAGGVAPLGELAPETLAVTVVEGWRGEVVQALETDARGGLRHYKVQDPSLLGWLGLALAVRDNPIYDFPICNKSFDLSYCGNDL